jgi:hypothetical protein
MPDVVRGTWSRRHKHGNVVDFWDNVDKTGDCWLWLGRMSAYGYGVWGREAAHVASWIMANGRRPRKWEKIHHKCKVRKCVRPDHIVALSPAQHNDIHHRK